MNPAQRLRELAFLNKGLKITLTDERSRQIHGIRFTGGIRRIRQASEQRQAGAPRFSGGTWKARKDTVESKSRCNTTTATRKRIRVRQHDQHGGGARTFPVSARR